VAGEDGAGEVLGRLSALLDKSLALAVAAGDDPRYSMLDVTREYAAERRDELGEADGLRRRHADYFARMAERAEPELGGAAQQVWYHRLEADHDNLRAALRWAVDAGDAELALRAAVALWQFWRANGDLAEGRRWLREALALDSGPPRLRARALWGAAWLASHQGDADEVERLSEELFELSGNDPDPLERRNALTVVGIAAMGRGRFADALPPLQVSTGYLGHAALLRGDVLRARSQPTESLTAFGGLGATRAASRRGWRACPRWPRARATPRGPRGTAAPPRPSARRTPAAPTPTTERSRNGTWRRRVRRSTPRLGRPHGRPAVRCPCTSRSRRRSPRNGSEGTDRGRAYSAAYVS